MLTHLRLLGGGNELIYTRQGPPARYVLRRDELLGLTVLTIMTIHRDS